MEEHKRTITTSIDLTPELLSAIKRVPAPITAKAVQDTTGWTMIKSTMGIGCPKKLGWIVGCPSNFSVTWTGEDNPDSLHINVSDNQFDILRFKNGIIGFKLPWSFDLPCPYTGLFVRPLPNQFNSNICILDSVLPPTLESYEIIIYWKIMNPNVIIDIYRNKDLAFIQPYNMPLWNETSLIMEENNAALYK